MSPNVQLTRMHRLPAGGVAIEITVHGRPLEGYLRYATASHVPQLVQRLRDVYQKNESISDVAEELSNLATWQPVAGQGNVVTINGATIIDDSNSADNIRGGLYALSQYPGRRIVVMGGSPLVELAEDITDAANVCILVGDDTRPLQTVLLKNGAVDTHHFEDSTEAANWLRRYIRSGDIVYITGPHSISVDALNTAQ